MTNTPHPLARCPVCGDVSGPYRYQEEGDPFGDHCFYVCCHFHRVRWEVDLMGCHLVCDHVIHLDKELQSTLLAYEPIRTGPTREELLERYSKHEPRAFSMYDGFAHVSSIGPEREVRGCYPDDDDDIVDMEEKWELITGSQVRVLVHRNTTKADALRLLKKIATRIEEDGLPDILSPWPTVNDVEPIPF